MGIRKKKSNQKGKISKCKTDREMNNPTEKKSNLSKPQQNSKGHELSYPQKKKNRGMHRRTVKETYGKEKEKSGEKNHNA